MAHICSCFVSGTKNNVHKYYGIQTNAIFRVMFANGGDDDGKYGGGGVGKQTKIIFILFYFDVTSFLYRLVTLMVISHTLFMNL